jgi:hypothetical protein
MEVAMAESSADQRRANKYAKLPEQVRPEDMITSQEARPQPAEKGEHDRETEFLLRTAGIF